MKTNSRCLFTWHFCIAISPLVDPVPCLGITGQPDILDWHSHASIPSHFAKDYKAPLAALCDCLTNFPEVFSTFFSLLARGAVLKVWVPILVGLATAFDQLTLANLWVAEGLWVWTVTVIIATCVKDTKKMTTMWNSKQKSLYMSLYILICPYIWAMYTEYA